MALKHHREVPETKKINSRVGKSALLLALM
jgi:hypothetical protein